MQIQVSYLLIIISSNKNGGLKRKRNVTDWRNIILTFAEWKNLRSSFSFWKSGDATNINTSRYQPAVVMSVVLWPPQPVIADLGQTARENRRVIWIISHESHKGVKTLETESQVLFV